MNSDVAGIALSHMNRDVPGRTYEKYELAGMAIGSILPQAGGKNTAPTQRGVPIKDQAQKSGRTSVAFYKFLFSLTINTLNNHFWRQLLFVEAL